MSGDPALQPLLACKDDDAAGAEIARLITERANPLIERIIRRSQLQPDFQTSDIEDLRGAIALRLVQRLRQMCAGEAAEQVRSFDDFVAVTAFHAVDDLIRKRHPRRAALKKRLHYALTTDPRLRLDVAGGEQIAALAQWNVGTQPLRTVSIARRDASAAMLDDARTAGALYAILGFLDAPVALDALVSLCADLWQIRTQHDGAAEELERVPDPRPQPHAEAQGKQSMAMLWSEIVQLPAPQRAALLLNLRESHGISAIPMLVFRGVATLDEIAAAAGVTRAELEAIWDDLPLDDSTIGRRLGMTAQRVVNLRKAARERLERRRMKRHF